MGRSVCYGNADTTLTMKLCVDKMNSLIMALKMSYKLFFAVEVMVVAWLIYLTFVTVD